MSALKVEPGAVVRLKSGGPKMTVAASSLYNVLPAQYASAALCIWFDGGTVIERHFAEPMLVVLAPGNAMDTEIPF